MFTYKGGIYFSEKQIDKFLMKSSNKSKLSVICCEAKFNVTSVVSDKASTNEAEIKREKQSN